MILHSIMISLSWYSAFFLMDDHSRELSVEHGDLSRDRKFKEVNRWLPLETLWRLKTGHLNCDLKEIPRKCEHLEIGLYIVRCFKWGEDPNVIAATFEDGLYAQVFKKAENLKFYWMPTFLHVAMGSTSILILTSSSRLCLRLFVNQANLDSGRRWLEIFHEVKTSLNISFFYRKWKCLC